MTEPRTFDPAEFVRDLREAGVGVSIIWRSRPDQDDGFMMEGPFKRSYSEVLARWNDAMDECPDYGQRVADYLRTEAAHVQPA